MTFEGQRKILAIVMKKFTGKCQILTGAPEKIREAFSRLTIWTVFNSAIFRHNFCAECHIFLTRPSKFRRIPILLLTPDLNSKERG